MGAMAAAVVGFVAGIALMILVDEALDLDGRFWDVLSVLVGLGGAVIAVRLLRLRAQKRTDQRTQEHRHRHA
jgi:high-affinity nickel permease